MKMKVILSTIMVAVFVVFASVWQVSAQTKISTTTSTTQQTAAQVLSKIMANQDTQPLAMYPQDFLDELKALGNSPYPPTPAPAVSTSKVKAAGLMSQNGLTPDGQTQQTIPTYAVVDLGVLSGDSFSYAYGINNNGQVVGTSSGYYGSDHAFLYSSGQMSNIGLSSGYSGADAFGINDKGEIVGQITQGGYYHGFFCSSGLMQDIGSLGGSYVLITSRANGINNLSQAVGFSQTSLGGSTDAFLYSGNSLIDLTTFGGIDSEAQAINSGGEIVGYYHSGDFPYFSHPFLYINGTIQDLGTLGGYQAGAYGINDSGQVVGGSFTNGNSFNHAFLFSGDVMQDLSTLGGSTSQASGINNIGEVVGDSTVSSGADHAFLYLGGVMHDLNSLVVPANSGWTLQQANAINRSGQIVGTGVNSLGQTHAFLLNPLPVGSQEAIEAQPSIKVYGIPPVKQVGKDSLVVITHGYQPFPLPTDVSFVDIMSNNISTNLTYRGISNWQVYGYKWVGNAWTFKPATALNNGIQEGINLGNSIANQGWTHVHLIAHSAGAGLIDTAATVIKTFSPGTIVQCTFLDPYDGYNFTGISTYGNSADWSDRYSASGDIENDIAPYTDIPLEYSYNVEVTDLDPVVESSGWFTGPTGLPTCTSSGSSHGWPVNFYQNTITGNTTSGYDGFGFPLSMEGGQWNYATNHYHVGNILSVTNLGIVPASCSSGFTVGSPTPVKTMNFSTDPTAWKSSTGLIIPNAGGVTLYSGSPAWFGTVVQTTNPVNVVSFDAEFTSNAGAAGLVSVCWDTNVIGSVDERKVIPGWGHYTLPFPVTTANGAHVLGFRLDPFTNIQSIVTLTNVVLSEVGVSQPFTLAVTTNMVNGSIVYQLTGQAGFDYGLQMSTNLVDWTQIGVLENTTGTVNFSDPSATNSAYRFYRAVAPY